MDIPGFPELPWGSWDPRVSTWRTSLNKPVHLGFNERWMTTPRGERPESSCWTIHWIHASHIFFLEDGLFVFFLQMCDSQNISSKHSKGTKTDGIYGMDLLQNKGNSMAMTLRKMLQIIVSEECNTWTPHTHTFRTVVCHVGTSGYLATPKLQGRQVPCWSHFGLYYSLPWPHRGGKNTPGVYSEDMKKLMVIFVIFDDFNDDYYL